MGCQLRSLLGYLLVVNSLHMCGKPEINDSMGAGTKVFRIVEMNAIVLPVTRCLSLMINHGNAHDAMLNAACSTLIDDTKVAIKRHVYS